MVVRLFIQLGMPSNFIDFHRAILKNASHPIFLWWTYFDTFSWIFYTQLTYFVLKFLQQPKIWPVNAPCRKTHLDYVTYSTPKFRLCAIQIYFNRTSGLCYANTDCFHSSSIFFRTVLLGALVAPFFSQYGLLPFTLKYVLVKLQSNLP